MAISTVSVGGATKGSQINEIIGVLNGTNSAPTVPAATDTAVWFYQDTAPVEWTIDGTPGDDLLAVKGGSQAYDAAGGTGAGTWTVAGMTKDAHAHTGPSHYHELETGTPDTSAALAAPYSTVATFGAENNSELKLINHTGSSTIYPKKSQTTADGTGATGPQSDAGISSAGTWRPKARLGIICTKD